MNRRSLLALSLSLPALSLSPSLAAAPPESAPSFAAARTRAQREKRLLFLLFTSSKCKQCGRFAEKVLETPAFREFARDHLSLMIYDVDAYAALPDAERELALSLEAKHGIDTLPGIVVFSPEGAELLRTQGYRGTAAEAIVAHLRSLLP